jgi:predicted membrane channel-forming protein YqfA (hemolysin III family)
VSFYLVGLIVILLLKTFVHNRSDDRVEWVRRVLELPADASILSLMAVVAASATRSTTGSDFGLWLLAEIAFVLVGVVLYKYGARNISDQTGQIQYDHFPLFVASFLVNVVIAVASVLVVARLGVF